MVVLHRCAPLRLSLAAADVAGVLLLGLLITRLLCLRAYLYLLKPLYGMVETMLGLGSATTSLVSS